jgi:hypothetical protein
MYEEKYLILFCVQIHAVGLYPHYAEGTQCFLSDVFLIPRIFNYQPQNGFEVVKVRKP